MPSLAKFNLEICTQCQVCLPTNVNVFFSSGHIPLRHLVYRVHALPGSMRPLIWDFGQLNEQVESLYTNQIVRRYVSTRKLSLFLSCKGSTSVHQKCSKNLFPAGNDLDLELYLYNVKPQIVH